MPAQTYLIYDNKTQTYSYTDLAGYNAWLNGIDIKPIASVPGSAVFDTTRPRNINIGDPFYNPLSVDSNATVVGGNQNLSISSVNNQTVGFQQLVQPGDGNGEIVFQRANSGGQIGDQERVDIGGPGVLGLGQLRLRSIDIVQDVSIKDDENVSTGNQPVNLAADQGYPDTSAAKRSGTVVTLESIDATAADLVTPKDIEGLNIPAGKLLKGDIVSVSEQTAIEGGYIAADPKISLERLPELAPKDYTTWSTRALILVATSPDTFGPYLALVQAELDRRGIPPDAYTTKLQQEITVTPLEAALGPRSSQVEGPPITAAQVEATVSNNQDLLDAWISAIGSESFQPATPTSIDFWRQNGWTLPEDLTLGPGEFFASAAMISEAKDSGIKFDVSGFIGTTRSGNPVYIVKNISGFSTDQEADAFWYTYAIKDVLKTVAQGINPERTEFGGSFDWFADARNPKGEGQIRTSLEAPDPLAADSTLVQELVREVNQEIQNDPAVLRAVTA